MWIDLMEVMDFFESRGVGVINASAVAMGMLAGPSVPDWHIAGQAIKDAAMSAWEACLQEGENLTELAVQWVFAQARVTTTLMSIQTQDQMTANIRMAERMSDKDNVTSLMTNKALVKAKAIFDDLLSTDWDNLELAR